MDALPTRVLRRRQLLAALLGAHLLAVLAMAACPELHHWVHRNVNDGEHECAVTLFLSGGCDAPAPTAPSPLAPPRAGEVFAFPILPAAWVSSVFALSRVFEHGPPSLR